MIYNIISLVKIKPVKRHNVHFFLQNRHGSINKNAHDYNFNFSIIHHTCYKKQQQKRHHTRCFNTA